MALNNLFNARTARVWNSLAQRYQPLQTGKTVGSFFSGNRVVTCGRSEFASARKTQAHSQWSDYRHVGRALLEKDLCDKRYKYDVSTFTQLPKSYDHHIDRIAVSKAFGFSPLFKYYVNPLSMVQFATKYVLSLRFFFIYMARTTFQAVRPLLAFCVFGEIMKLILANISGGVPAFLFSFVLAFEVLYFFLQCYISYTFLTMFFTVMF